MSEFESVTTERSTFRATVTEINLPNAVGWDWMGEPWVNDEGLEVVTQHQLVWSRPGGAAMTYSTKGADGRWNHTVSRHPRMVGIETLAEARRVAHWFIHNEEGDRP